MGAYWVVVGEEGREGAEGGGMFLPPMTT